jgi:hyperosmotically inducible protein
MFRHGWVISLTLALVACDQAQEDRAAQQAADAVHKGNQALRNLGDKAREGTDKAANAAREGGRELSATLSDTAITARVKTALLAEQGVDGYRIDVTTRAGTVTLTGTVSDPRQVERAGEIAQSAKGVKAVENKLSVENTLSQAR